MYICSKATVKIERSSTAPLLPPPEKLLSSLSFLASFVPPRLCLTDPPQTLRPTSFSLCSELRPKVSRLNFSRTFS